MTQPDTLQTNPLPRLGYCPGCHEEIRLRLDGTLHQHARYNARCWGSRQVRPALEPTFVRWLHANASRKDGHTNRVTGLAQMLFRRCTRTPNRTPADVSWTTAEELHSYLHRRHQQRTGSEHRGGIGGERCDWACRDVEEAGRVYAELLDAAGSAA